MALTPDRWHTIYCRAVQYFKRILPGLGNGPTDQLAALAADYVDDPDQFK